MSDSTENPAGVRFHEKQSGFLALTLVTEVRDDGLYVKFGPLHRTFHRIPWDDIESARVTAYSPTEYGGWGWGIRVSPTGSKKAYRISGDSGVEIRRSDAVDLFVGSNRPEELRAAIEQTRAEQ